MKKRMLSFLFVLIGLFGLIGCQSMPYDGHKAFDNAEDYSDLAGYMGWNYFYGDVEWNPTPMAYIPYYGCYRSNRVSVTKSEWDPHQEHDIIMCHTAQRSGKANVNIALRIIQRQKPVDDGVIFRAYDNDLQLLYEVLMTGAEEDSKAEKELSIKLAKGEKLWFTLSAGARDENDLTDVKVSVRF